MEERQFQACPNCGTDLQASDHYCPTCGQKNIDKKVTLRHLFKDFLGDYFTFDSKLFHSLYPLLFRPGKMTREFLDGKRERFIPPLRMFIFLSFVLLLLLSFRIKDVEDDRIFSRATSADSTAVQQSDAIIKFNSTDDDNGVLARADSLSDIYPAEQVVDSVAAGQSFFIRLGLRQFIKLKQTKGRGFLSFIIGHGTLILMAISLSFTLVLYLFYFRQERFFISHFIASIHLHSFLVLSLIIATILSWLIWSQVFLFLLTFIAAIYLFISLKITYRQRVKTTIWKTILLSMFYLLFLLPTAIFISLAIGFLLF